VNARNIEAVLILLVSNSTFNLFEGSGNFQARIVRLYGIVFLFIIVFLVVSIFQGGIQTRIFFVGSTFSSVNSTGSSEGGAIYISGCNETVIVESVFQVWR
jgi:hypothetical protein